MSSFLMYRFIVDSRYCFDEKYKSPSLVCDVPRMLINDSYELENHLRNAIEEASRGKRIALALSGGIDSAVLAKCMPKGSTAYTLKCVVPGMQVVDETKRAAEYAKECGLKHKIVEVFWEDFELDAPMLMHQKNSPTHSIEVQVYKAAVQAKRDGFDSIVFGETADCVYGGHSNLLSKDWTVGDFAERWTFVKPYRVLKDSTFIMDPYEQYESDGYVDVPRFLSEFEYFASLNFYLNATKAAGIELIVPYATTRMKNPLDLKRVRNGDNKYLVREVFSRLYPGFEIPAKVPMPRPMDEWLADWKGPSRNEFWPHCIEGMTGDQKWLVWSLERFLNMIDDH